MWPAPGSVAGQDLVVRPGIHMAGLSPVPRIGAHATDPAMESVGHYATN